MHIFVHGVETAVSMLMCSLVYTKYMHVCVCFFFSFDSLGGHIGAIRITCMVVSICTQYTGYICTWPSGDTTLNYTANC